MEPTAAGIDLVKTGMTVLILAVQCGFAFALWTFGRAQKETSVVMKQMSDAQERIAGRLEKITDEFYTLKGQHQAMMCQHNVDEK